MGAKKFVVLGGYGGAGEAICRLLLKETDVDLVVAGRRVERALDLCQRLNREYPGDRASWARADASDQESLSRALQGADLVVSASSTATQVGHVARASLDAGADYLDIHFLQAGVPVLQEMAPRIRDAGRFFMTQAGFCPGLPAVMVRRAAPLFDRYVQARVGVAMSSRFETPGSIMEIIDYSADYTPELFRDGRWQSAGFWRGRRLEVPGFGRIYCYPMMLEELRGLPQTLGLDQLGLYAAGVDWFVDYVITPLSILSRSLGGAGREQLGRLMMWGEQRFSSPDENAALVLEAEGSAGGQPAKVKISIRHHDVYLITAASVVSALLQYLDGSIRRPGLWLMGQQVDPSRHLEDLRRMGVEVLIQGASESL
ncbi:MAG: hypothetical protein GKC10_07405 [Methanosarcinales archaeon]|nr:hypothetical protein [Methanosarcinales archaeon]